MPTDLAPTAISPAQRTHFRDRGYLIVPGLLTAAELEACHEIHAAASAAGRAELALGAPRQPTLWEEQAGADGRAMLRKVDCPFDRYPAFRTVFTRRKVLDVVRDLIGDPAHGNLYYHSSKMMCKPPHVGRRKPWHQDFAYWPDMDPQQLTLWVAIDPATRENGCMQLIPGSHRDGLIRHEQIEDWQIREDGIDAAQVVHAEMAPGDALFFDVLTLHASDPNRSEHARLSAIIDYAARPGRSRNGLGSEDPLQPSD